MSPSSLAKAWRQFWCQHEFNIEDIRRPDPDKAPVVCHCRRCMKLHTAAYGLVLPGRLTRRTEVVPRAPATEGLKGDAATEPRQIPPTSL